VDDALTDITFLA